MHFPPGIIKLMAEQCAERLLAERAVTGADRVKLVQLVTRAIAEELRVEETLLAEADRLIEEHYKEVRAQGADVGELRAKILHKLARDRGVVLR